MYLQCTYFLLYFKTLLLLLSLDPDKVKDRLRIKDKVKDTTTQQYKCYFDSTFKTTVVDQSAFQHHYIQSHKQNSTIIQH